MTVGSCEKKYDTVVGSWFNSGFHGHNRSLPRNYYNTFREISKPTPPRQFSSRAQEGTFSHPFTKHDNKKTFTNDIDQLAMYGLRKDPDRSKGKFNKGLVGWDKKHDSRRYLSCYRMETKSAPINYRVKDCMKDWEPLGNKMEFNTMYREHYCRQTPVTHELRAKSASLSGHSVGRQSGHSLPETRNKRPKTTNLVTRDRERPMELRPEWMGASLTKQRNQSDFSLANEYHGYSWEDRQSGEGSRRSSVHSRGSRRSSTIRGTSGELRDMGTNTDRESGDMASNTDKDQI